MEYVTSQRMREIDRRAIEEFGVPSIVLMENAGQGASCVALDMLREKKKGEVVFVCGKGNNGGDGFVCARHLINKGVEAEIFLLGHPHELKGDAGINYKILKNIGSEIRTVESKDEIGELEKVLNRARLIVDAIFGIGLSGEVREPYRKVINFINQSQRPVLSLDVPSGLDATEGKVLGVSVKAHKTVTFALPKTGFVKDEGPVYTGELIIVDISIPRILLSESGENYG